MKYKLFKNLIAFGIFLGLAFSVNCEEQTDWCFNNTTQQAFYMFEGIEIDAEPIEELDVIGAFLNDVCVGWFYADPAGFTTLAVMGYDNSDYSEGYLLPGDVPDLYIYDSN